MTYDDTRATECRREFPGLERTVYGKPLIYLDNAATTQVSRAVVEAVTEHMLRENANTHRGAHYLSQRATERLEETRDAVAAFLNAGERDCVVFNSGATAGLNTVALGLEAAMGPGDAVLVTELEHHSNFLPWQQLCRRTGAQLRVAPLNDSGDVDTGAFERLLDDGRVRVAAMTHTSNVTGAVCPVASLTRMARRKGALSVVDAAQGVRNGLLDVSALDCDFLCFSAHKMLGPTGVGVLYGKREPLSALSPSVFGGGMVDGVERGGCAVSPLPFRLEAGTPNIAGIAGLGAAVASLKNIGTDWIAERERRLTEYLAAGLREIEGVTVLGEPELRRGAVSFVVAGRHPYDLASVMDKLGVALRAGHHCAIPCLRHFGLESSLRLSPAFYNLFSELDEALAALREAIGFFSKWEV